jgi:hypothetical protein
MLTCVLTLGGVQSHGYWHRHDAEHRAGHDQNSESPCEICAVAAQAMGDGQDPTVVLVSPETPAFAVETVKAQVPGSRVVGVVRSRGPPSILS